MSLIRLEFEDSLAILSLAAPDEGNRIRRAMMAALIEAIARIATTPDLRALLIRADGDQFCVGGAIDEFGSDEPLSDTIARDLGRAHDAINTLSQLPFPIISALRGAVAGGGIGLALSADIILAGEDVNFRSGYPGIGLSPDLGTSWQVLRRAGPTVAAEFLMSNRRMAATEALSHGLVNTLHPPARLEEEARATALRMAQGPTHSYAAIRSLINTPGADLAAHLAREAALMEACAGTADSARAITDFLAGNAPVFHGR